MKLEDFKIRMAVWRVDEVTGAKLTEFKELAAESTEWLNEALTEFFRQFGKESEDVVLLPRTPSTKRKFARIAKGDEHLASTFHEESNKKKIKIDELSSIIDTSICSTEPGETSKRKRRPRKAAKKAQIKLALEMVDEPSTVEENADTTETDIDNSCIADTIKRRRRGKKKSPSEPVTRSTRSKRATASDNYSSQETSVPMKLTYDPPVKRSTRASKQVSADIDSSQDPGDSETSSVVLVCDSPKSPDLLAKSKALQRAGLLKKLGEIEMVCDSPKSPVVLAKRGALCHAELQKKCEVQEGISMHREPFEKAEVVRAIEEERAMHRERIEMHREQLLKEEVEKNKKKEIEIHREPYIETLKSTPIHNLKFTPKGNETPVNSPIISSLKDLKIEISIGEVSDDIESPPVENLHEEVVDDTATPPMVNSHEEMESPDYNSPPSGDDDGGDRRGTYKIMVEDIIDGKGEDCNPAVGEGKKGPTIVKPVIVKGGGNILTSIKTMMKRVNSPKKDIQAEKAARLEQKDMLRKKLVEETQLKKQKQLEEKRKQRELREKRFAATQIKRLEEEERRRKQLEMKAKQVEEKQEEIRKQREAEEKLKKQARDAKIAEYQARRQREEEEAKKKAAELLLEEKRKKEMLQQIKELEEQKRLELKAKHEKAEKERLHDIEHARKCDEDRKKKEFEQKEKHRNEVEKKKREAMAKARLENNLLREERQKQAEEDINNAKEIEKAKMLKAKMLKAHQPAVKENMYPVHKEAPKVDTGPVPNEPPKPFRNSPILVEKERLTFNTFKMPSKDMPTVKSPAAFRPKAAACLPAKASSPVRESYVSYDINDLCSDDSSDDESAPAKRVPNWALGDKLRRQLLNQFYTDVDPADIFIDCMQPLRLDQIFQGRKKKRYFKRTSSAQWNSPPIGFKHTHPLNKSKLV